MNPIGTLWRAIPPFVVAALLLQCFLEKQALRWTAVGAAVLYILGAHLLRRVEDRGRRSVRLRLLELGLIAIFHVQIAATPNALLLYHLSNARAATLFSRRGSLLFAALTAGVYEVAVAWSREVTVGAAYAGQLFFDTLGFVLVALFANHLAAMEREHRRRKAAIEDLVTQLQQSYRQLEDHAAQVREMAITDEMTGLYNYRYFCEYLRREVARAERTGEVFTLLFLDVDHFKRFNDTYGHPAGDRLLADIASILRSCVREMDLVARYGGEEFAIVLPETGREEGVEIAERIRRVVAASPLNLPGRDAAVRATVSIGVTTYPLDAATHDELIQVADRYLYQAKVGRNRVVARETGAPQQGRLF